MVQVILEFLLSENKQRMLSECEMFSFRQCLLPQRHFFLFLQTLVVCCGQNAVIFFYSRSSSQFNNCALSHIQSFPSVVLSKNICSKITHPTLYRFLGMLVFAMAKDIQSMKFKHDPLDGNDFMCGQDEICIYEMQLAQ